MKPIAAMEKPAMMNGDRCCTCSDQKAKMRTMIMAKTSTREALANHSCQDETGSEIEQSRDFSGSGTRARGTDVAVGVEEARKAIRTAKMLAQEV